MVKAADGSIACWGVTGLPQTPPLAGAFRSVVTGPGHVCGLRSNGTVACWNKDPPASLNGKTVTKLVGNWFGPCALLSDGSITCW